MNPYFIIHDPSHQNLANAEFVGNGLLRHFPRLIKRPNFRNLIRSKLGINVSLAALIGHIRVWPLSPLFIRILNIVAMSSKKKMVWPYTKTNITFVKNQNIFWNWAINKHPCDAMSPCGDFIKAHRPIPAIIFSSNPKPAISRLINLIPKIFHDLRLPNNESLSEVF